MLLIRTQLPLQQSLSSAQVPCDATQQIPWVQPALESQQSLLEEQACWLVEQQLRLKLQPPQQLKVQLWPVGVQLPPPLPPELEPVALLPPVDELPPPIEEPRVLVALVLFAPDELPPVELFSELLPLELLSALLPLKLLPALLPLELAELSLLPPLEVAPRVELLALPEPVTAPLDADAAVGPTWSVTNAGSLCAPPAPEATAETTQRPGSGEVNVPSLPTVAPDPGEAVTIDQVTAAPEGTVAASSFTLWPGAIGEGGGTMRTSSGAATPQLASPLAKTTSNAAPLGSLIVLLVAEGDAPAREIVGGQLDFDAIAGDDANVELLHLSAGIREYLRALVDADAVHPAGKRLLDGPFDFDSLFLFRH